MHIIYKLVRSTLVILQAYNTHTAKYTIYTIKYTCNLPTCIDSLVIYKREILVKSDYLQDGGLGRLRR